MELYLDAGPLSLAYAQVKANFDSNEIFSIDLVQCYVILSIFHYVFRSMLNALINGMFKLQSNNFGLQHLSLLRS